MNRNQAKIIAIGTLRTAHLMAKVQAGLQDCMRGYVFEPITADTRMQMEVAVSAVLNAAAPPGVPVNMFAQHVSVEASESDRGTLFITPKPDAPVWVRQLINQLAK